MNSIGVVGYCDSVPELRESAHGKQFCNFLLAVPVWIKDAVEQPAAELYKVTCFGSLATHVGSNVRKGQRLVVAGRFEVETWTARDGTERSTNKIVAEAVGLDLRFAALKQNRQMSEANIA